MTKRGRPKKEPIPYDADEVRAFIERFFNIEHEIVVLREDKKELKAEFKDKIDQKLVDRVIQLVKKKVKLEIDTNASEQTIDEIEDVVRNHINKVM